MSVDEINTLRSFHRGVTLLHSRLSDATVRLLRLQVLEASNVVEDILLDLNKIAAQRSQNLRLPLPRFILSHLPGKFLMIYM